MIEIKKALHTTIRHDPIKSKCTMDIVITLTDGEFLVFDLLLKKLSIDPTDLLNDMIDAGMDDLFGRYYPEECE